MVTLKALFSFIILVAAATSFAQPERGFDVNDVSFLFPWTGDRAVPFYPDLTVQKSKFLSANLFANVTKRFVKATQGDVDCDTCFTPPNYSNMALPYIHVVNFRYDPCFVELTPQQCTQQIRLVVQVVEPGDTINSPIKGLASQIAVPDYSIHLLYNIGTGLPKVNDPVLSEVLKLKRLIEASGFSQAGKALNVSPALTAEMQKQPAGKLGPIAAQLKSIIDRFATSSRLSELTMINGDADAALVGQWNFMGGKVKGDEWLPQPIPRVPQHGLLQVTDSEGDFSTGAIVTGPRTLSIDANTKLEAQNDSQKTTFSLNDLETILSPQKSNPRNMDCASCHLASISEFNIVTDSKLQLPSQFQAYQVPKGITGFATHFTNGDDNRVNFQNVHVIGYFDDHVPVVTPLVAQSAAAVAETLNKILRLQPPTVRDCTSVEVKECFMDEKKTEADCLSLCK